MSPGKLILAILVLALVACRPEQRMANQPSYQPLEASAFFEDGQSARQPVPGTVARGHLRDDSVYYTGRTGGELANVFPFEIGAADLRRGQERYDIYCAPCHSRTGEGDGMIVRRGYRRPPSFHSDLLRERPAGHVFDVITNGFGVMPPYAAQIPVRDRWLITAYVRALQLSRNARIQDVPANERMRLSTGGIE